MCLGCGRIESPETTEEADAFDAHQAQCLAAVDKNQALRKVYEMQANCIAHKRLEGEDVEYRTQNGGWTDVLGDLEELRQMLEKQ